MVGHGLWPTQQSRSASNNTTFERRPMPTRKANAFTTPIGHVGSTLLPGRSCGSRPCAPPRLRPPSCGPSIICCWTAGHFPSCSNECSLTTTATPSWHRRKPRWAITPMRWQPSTTPMQRASGHKSLPGSTGHRRFRRLSHLTHRACSLSKNVSAPKSALAYERWPPRLASAFTTSSKQRGRCWFITTAKSLRWSLAARAQVAMWSMTPTMQLGSSS